MPDFPSVGCYRSGSEIQTMLLSLKTLQNLIEIEVWSINLCEVPWVARVQIAPDKQMSSVVQTVQWVKGPAIQATFLRTLNVSREQFSCFGPGFSAL